MFPQRQCPFWFSGPKSFKVFDKIWIFGCYVTGTKILISIMKHLFHTPSNYCPVICGNCIFGNSQAIWDRSRVLVLGFWNFKSSETRFPPFWGRAACFNMSFFKVKMTFFLHQNITKNCVTKMQICIYKTMIKIYCICVSSKTGSTRSIFEE